MRRAVFVIVIAAWAVACTREHRERLVVNGAQPDDELELYVYDALACLDAERMARAGRDDLAVLHASLRGSIDLGPFESGTYAMVVLARRGACGVVASGCRRWTPGGTVGVSVDLARAEHPSGCDATQTCVDGVCRSLPSECTAHGDCQVAGLAALCCDQLCVLVDDADEQCRACETATGIEGCGVLPCCDGRCSDPDDGSCPAVTDGGVRDAAASADRLEVEVEVDPDLAPTLPEGATLVVAWFQLDDRDPDPDVELAYTAPAPRGEIGETVVITTPPEEPLHLCVRAEGCTDERSCPCQEDPAGAYSRMAFAVFAIVDAGSSTQPVIAVSDHVVVWSSSADAYDQLAMGDAVTSALLNGVFARDAVPPAGFALFVLPPGATALSFGTGPVILTACDATGCVHPLEARSP